MTATARSAMAPSLLVLGPDEEVLEEVGVELEHLLRGADLLRVQAHGEEDVVAPLLLLDGVGEGAIPHVRLLHLRRALLGELGGDRLLPLAEELLFRGKDRD